MNFHLNRTQRRYLAKAVGAKKKGESLSARFDRIRQSQAEGKQIHAANVEGQYLQNSEEYLNPKQHEEISETAVQALLDSSRPMSSEEFSGLKNIEDAN